jgi:ribosomal protein L11 methyltransferase
MKADLVVANILANPLKMLAPLLASHVRTGGRIALAGVLSAQAAEVEGIYSPWFDFEPGVEEEGWVCLSGQRKPGQ